MSPRRGGEAVLKKRPLSQEEGDAFADPSELCGHVKDLRFQWKVWWEDIRGIGRKGDSSDLGVHKLPLTAPLGTVEQGRPESRLLTSLGVRLGGFDSSGSFETGPHNYSTCLLLRGGSSVLSLLESAWVCKSLDQ